MTLKEILETAAPYLSTGIASVIFYWFGRKKTSAEVSAIEATAVSSELHNVETAISIYRKLSEDLQVQIKGLKQELEKVYGQLGQVKEQNKTLINENRQLKGQLQSLEDKINQMQQ